MKSPTKKPDGAKRLPVAPPVYRPQPVPKVLQRKVATAPPSNASVLPQRKPPVAPPVYRPQSQPKVLQAKSNLPQRKPPVAPPVYRPTQKPKVLQPKSVGPPIRTLAQPKATPAPVKPPRRVAAPVFSCSIQRAINWESDYMGRQASNVDELIDQLVERYGDDNRAKIAGIVNDIESQNPVWSMKQIWVYFSKLNQDGHLPVHRQVEFGASHLAPPPRPLKSFVGSARATYLVAQVGARKFDPLRNVTKSDQHAEDVFIREVEAAHKEGQINLRTNPPIKITINNSPCVGRCAGALANWVEEWKLTSMTIFFMNPFGSDEEFSEAITILQGAGIKVHGFDVSKEQGDEPLSKGARARAERMGDSLRGVRARELYESDPEEQEEERRGRRRSRSVSAASSRDRSRSRSGRRAAEAPEPARGPARPRRSLRRRSPSPEPLRPPAPEPPHPAAAPRTRAAVAAAAAGLLDDDSD